MTRQRRSHEQKSDDDRRSYVATSVRPANSPTLDEGSLDFGSTEISRVPSGQTAVFAPTKQEKDSLIPKGIKENLVEVIISAILFPLLAWVGYQVFSLNREVGELRMSIENIRVEMERGSRELEKTEERLQREIERSRSATVPADALQVSPPPAKRP